MLPLTCPSPIRLLRLDPRILAEELPTGLPQAGREDSCALAPGRRRGARTDAIVKALQP
jgi:hypothetical protein